jgi:hypothetical protein
MNEQISNKNTFIYKFCFILFAFLLIFQIKEIYTQIIFCLLLILGYYISFGRFWKIILKNEALYCTYQLLFFSKRIIIPLENIRSVKIEILPSFQVGIYKLVGVKIIYQSEEKVIKTILFLSKEIFFFKSLENTPEITFLKKNRYIKET